MNAALNWIILGFFTVFWLPPVRCHGCRLGTTAAEPSPWSDPVARRGRPVPLRLRTGQRHPPPGPRLGARYYCHHRRKCRPDAGFRFPALQLRHPGSGCLRLLTPELRPVVTHREVTPFRGLPKFHRSAPSCLKGSLELMSFGDTEDVGAFGPVTRQPDRAGGPSRGRYRPLL
jgi:hypothetical protein